MGIQPWIGQSIISFCLGSLAPRLSQCQGKGEHRPLTQQCGSFVFFLVQVVLYRRNTPRLYYRVHRVHSPSLVRRTYFRVAKHKFGRALLALPPSFSPRHIWLWRAQRLRVTELDVYWLQEDIYHIVQPWHFGSQRGTSRTIEWLTSIFWTFPWHLAPSSHHSALDFLKAASPS